MKERRRVGGREGEDDRRYAGEGGVAANEAGEREDDEQRRKDGEKKEVRHLRRFADEVVIDEAAGDVAAQGWKALDVPRDDGVQSGTISG
jgi:hypothetical protein